MQRRQVCVYGVRISYKVGGGEKGGCTGIAPISPENWKLWCHNCLNSYNRVSLVPRLPPMQSYNRVYAMMITYSIIVGLLYHIVGKWFFLSLYMSSISTCTKPWQVHRCKHVPFACIYYLPPPPPLPPTPCSCKFLLPINHYLEANPDCLKVAFCLLWVRLQILICGNEDVCIMLYGIFIGWLMCLGCLKVAFCLLWVPLQILICGNEGVCTVLYGTFIGWLMCLGLRVFCRDVVSYM